MAKKCIENTVIFIQCEPVTNPVPLEIFIGFVQKTTAYTIKNIRLIKA